MNKSQEQYDIVVIGGGPAGMMAAGRAAELGAKVVLIEKNKSLGKKLLLSGHGRCNLTQAIFDVKELISRYGKKGRFLFSAFSVFGPRETLTFLLRRGLSTKVEGKGRVFPKSDQAQDVLQVLLIYVKEHRVSILMGKTISHFETEKDMITRVHLSDRVISAKQFIIATGGKSYPTTGSTGDGFDWAQSFGHTIVTPLPALVPLKVQDTWAADLQGLSLKNVQINIFQSNKKQAERFGDMIFTHYGLSGPIILDVSKEISTLLKNGTVVIEMDLKPALSLLQLDKRLQRDFAENLNKDFKNYLPELLPQKLVDVFITLAGIEGKRKINSISKEERKHIIKLLKSLRLTVSDTMGWNQAMVTSGGVPTREIDPKTMRSKKVSNLFFAGEIMDIDGPTGGYNLQISWSTGYAAGTAAAIQLE